ncbi:Actin cross-linking [Cynara cardunculus var. scolymus]|uniref:Actin cross-linking n=1 Tax=Cynara cardunculus var. scolymus TaxID=59895 RepID=A0A103Y2D2_CYNCS|nr:Actin cross-linking [Cynara cardunculus var. scolymus]
MELFEQAKKIRLRSIKDKYLVAEKDEESVSQDRDGSTENAEWEVYPTGEKFLRFKSYYGKYLMASNSMLLEGVKGKKVMQTELKPDIDGSVEWEPLRDGFQVRLKTVTGSFLRPIGGVPPWRNSVTHDICNRQKTKEKVLWNVEIVETLPSYQNNGSEKKLYCKLNI